MKKVEDLWLSKSKIFAYLHCPYSFKKMYLDEVKQIPSPAMERGTTFHKAVEEHYRTGNFSIPLLDYDSLKISMRNFIEFEKKRIAACKNNSQKTPVLIEQKLFDKELQFSGIVDTVFMHPSGELILLDWKTGKFKDIEDMRLELAFYVYLIEKTTNHKIKYYSMYFPDIDVLFFEEVDRKLVENAQTFIIDIKNKINTKVFEPKLNEYCNWCQFKGECKCFQSSQGF
jgi:putative RecB family exonuclease